MFPISKYERIRRGYTRALVRKEIEVKAGLRIYLARFAMIKKTAQIHFFFSSS